MENPENENARSMRWGLGNAILARVAMARGELREAEAHARSACEHLVLFMANQPLARSTLSNILRAQGRAAEAREIAELGARELEQMGNAGLYAVPLRLALAEACFAEGDASAGEAALREALQCVRDRANDIPEPAVRERFLTHVPENARTLALARERWDELPA
jgi:eukaryotic-like serine/threonine-protein kinase